MKEHDKRIALRLPSEQLEQLQKLVREKKARNLSALVRKAINEFLA